MNISNIHEESAKKAYQELLNALGTENNPNQWLSFMDATKRHLPFLFESGRPTKEQINNSIVGVLGFTGWSEMIEAPVSGSGLSWSVNTWKQWKKAFNVVERFSYLRSMSFSPGAVLKLNTMFEGEMPETSEKLEKEKHQLARAKAEEKENKQNELIHRVRELESQLLVSNSKNEELQKQNYSMLQMVTDFKSVTENLSTVERDLLEREQNNKELCSQITKMNEANTQLETDKKKLIRVVSHYRSLKITGRLRFLFMGN